MVEIPLGAGRHKAPRTAQHRQRLIGQKLGGCLEVGRLKR